MDDACATIAHASAMLAAGRERAARVLAQLRAAASPAELPATIAADHPLAMAVGQEEAQRLADLLHGKPIGRFAVAADRREMIARLSRERRPLREIALAANCHRAYVVQVRRSLREGGDLPATLFRR